MTQPASTGLLADDLFFVVHDSAAGRPGLHPRTVGFGLAGALLGELALDRRISVDGDPAPLRVVDRTPPSDALAHTVLDQLLRESAVHPVRDWLSFLAPIAMDEVAERLRRAGLVTRGQPWRRRGSRWAPADSNLAAMPATRVRNRLLRNAALAVPDVLLVRLALAMGLGPDLLWDAPAHTGAYLNLAVSTLPAPLPELIKQTEAVIGNTVASHRV